MCEGLTQKLTFKVRYERYEEPAERTFQIEGTIGTEAQRGETAWKVRGEQQELLWLQDRERGNQKSGFYFSYRSGTGLTLYLGCAKRNTAFSLSIADLIFLTDATLNRS